MSIEQGQENLDREVAVKVLPPWFAADRNFVERFNLEDTG